MDRITIEEKKIVDELRKRTIHDATPKMLEDVSLFYRFAKARDFNLPGAEEFLRKHIAWRKEVHLDEILRSYEPPEVLVKYVPTTIICFDNEGSIVRYVDCGRIDPNGLWNSVKKPEFAKYLIYHMERDRDMLIKKGLNLGKPLYYAILDFEDLTYANAVNIRSLQYMLYTLKIFLDNYPETIRRVSIINAPSYFAWLFSAIKPILPKRVLQKVGIYGSDGWKEELLEAIDAADLPAFLGGTKTDPDGNPQCYTFIHRGRPVPRSYYTSKESKKLSLVADAEKLTVKPFSKEEINVRVKEENSYLQWEFEIKNRDIDFSLYFKGNSSGDFEPEEIIPRQRLDTSDEPGRGFLRCEKAGYYIIVFDNSYSWFHSKDVYFKVEIKKPKNEDH